MSDLIDRQEAIDIINTYVVPIHGYIGTPNDSEVYAYARGLLLSIERNMRALPSAQPEIIRCKECKYYDGRPCEIVDWYNTEDDFCSYAERKEE